MKVTGKIESVSFKEKGWSIKVNGVWYGCFIGLQAPQKDQEVTFEFEKSGQWNNITKMDAFGNVPDSHSTPKPKNNTVIGMLTAYVKDDVASKRETLLKTDYDEEKLWKESQVQVLATYKFFEETL